jgi:cell wall-associated NlpC family hydrolase
VSPRRARTGSILTLVVIGGIGVIGICTAFLLLLTSPAPSSDCRASGPSSIALDPPGTGQEVGATEYGGPGDPSSGVTGARGDNLLAHPDSYAELGGVTWQTATAMGGLPYMAPLRITWGGHSVIAYKRDFGLGGGPVDGEPRDIDLWWQVAGRLGIPYENGLWSGPVQVERPPAAGSADVLGQVVSAAPAGEAAACSTDAADGVPLTAGPRAALQANGLAAAPADSPAAVRAMIAAGNQIVGKPYVYGGGHGVPLSEIAPAYDCSSSVEHLLYGAGLVPVDDGAASSALESFGAPGPGRWVTLYASADHVFMYVAGLRWDTHDAAGSGDGSTGIGWHPLVRTSAGFVARHPEGL